MKTKETLEEVSSHPGEKGLGSPETPGNTSGAEEKPRRTRQKGLQIRGKGAKSRKRPTLFVGKNPNGKSQLKPVTRCCCGLKVRR
jgi:hypothetical protein